MCGFVAMWRPGKGLPADERLAAIRDLMQTRGPDDAGLWRDGEVALGHRRLAVIDLSAAGHQPMERHGVYAAFNGEIYNYRALRTELEAEGERFESESDTEVLPVGLRAWGFERLLAKLDGMFAFVLWDARERRMYAARDRVGEKPLYYSLAGGFTAASDIKAVAAALPSPPPIEPGILPLYLFHGFIPAPWTIYRDVAKLPPATALVVELKDHEPRARIFSYWQLDYAPKRRIGAAEAEAELDALLGDAVRERLVADVPVGAFLSGGVDSSLIVSYAAEVRPNLQTFSIGFRHASHDELPYARMVAQRWDTQHHEEVLEIDVLGALPHIVWNHGEPFADSSAVPSHAVAEAARRHVTVVLTGDGGDEAFAGYPNARAAWLAGYYKRAVAYPWRHRADRLLGRLAARHLSSGVLRKAATLARYGARPGGVAYVEPDLWRDDLRSSLLTETVKRAALISPAGLHHALSMSFASQDELDVYLGTDLRLRLPGDYLTKVDVATMAVGLEARTPFLSPRVLEFAARLPREVLLPFGQPKGLVKSLAVRRLPPAAVLRPKAGFALPLGAWMRDEFGGVLRRTLLGPQALGRGFFRPAAVRRLLDEHAAGRGDHSGRLWTLLVWETWCQVFLDARRPGDLLREVAA